MKRLAKFIGVLLALLISAALVIPLVVDVDKYRPQIVEAANQKMNGTLELGKLSLSLWGQVRIAVSGLKLRDLAGNEVVSVNDAFFHVPFVSLLSGSPILTFKMDQPTVNVIKSRVGKLNVMSLVKVAAPSSEKSSAGPAPTPIPTSASTESSSQKKSGALPAMVSNARLGVELNHALINYRDDLTGLKSDVKDLNFVLKDISLSHPTEIEVWADLDTRMGKLFSLRGPARLKGLATPRMMGNESPQFRFTANLDLDGLAIAVPGFFEKKAGVPANAELKLVGSETQAKIEQLRARFFNAELTAEGVVNQLNTTPVVGLALKTNEIQLKPWAELIPLLKEYDLGGFAQMEFNLKGTSEQPAYSGKVLVNSLNAKLPKLKTNPKFDGVVSISTDQVDNLLMTMTAPGNELKIQGRILSFSRPKMDFSVTSTGMDLDQLIEFPPPNKKTAANTQASPTSEGQQAATASNTKPISDYDAMLSPLRENKILAATEINLALNMKLLKAYNVKMTDLGCSLGYKNLIADFKSCGLRVFSGAVKATSQMNFRTKTPVYSFTGQVADLDMAQAIESQMALFKNTLTGKANMTFRGQGSSFNPDAAMAAISGTGNMKVNQAVFATIDVMKMVKDAVNESLGKLGDRIPALKGKTLTHLPNHESKYETVTSDFTIADRKFHAPNLIAQATPNLGIDLKGNTTVGIKDYSLSTVWEVIDTYNLTHLRDISIDEAGIQVPHVFAEGNAPVHFTVNANCTIMAPCYSYVEVPAYLSKVALNNIGNAMAGKAKDEVRKKAETFIDRVAPKEIPSELKDKLKGLFH
ncbi:MAG: hypothetical protein ABIQ95_03710 [Bdellovibrionia bacterium]